LRSLRDAGDGLSRRPIAEIIEVVGRVGERFLDPLDPLRLESEALVATEAGYTSPMAKAVIEGMAGDWTRARLDLLVRGDFPDRAVLDGFVPGPGGSLVRAFGGRLAFHIGAGSVPGVGATSLLRSLLVKCPVLLKPGHGDRALPTLLSRGISEADGEIAAAVAVEYWPGREGGALETAAFEAADRVVVYGGLDTVESVRKKIPPTTPLVAYPHRISIGAVPREALASEESARRTAEEVAYATTLFEQRGCVSPHVIWTESGGRVTPSAWASQLGKALERAEVELPAAPLDPPIAAEIQQSRAAVELRQAAGSQDRWFGGKGLEWTVLFEGEDRPIRASGGRTVRVREIPDLTRLGELLAPYGAVLQTLAVAGSGATRLRIAESLARSGLTRVTGFRDQPWPPPSWRHDGQGPLQVLVRWVAVEPDLAEDTGLL